MIIIRTNYERAKARDNLALLCPLPDPLYPHMSASQTMMKRADMKEARKRRKLAKEAKLS